MKQRVEDFIAAADENPFSVTVGSNLYVVTGSEIRETFRLPVYVPSTLFRSQAQLLAEMLNGNYTLLAAALGVPNLESACSNFTNAGVALQWDAQTAIACSDGSDAGNHSIPYYADYVQQLKQISPTWGGSWAEIRFSCANWKVPAAWRFAGPFASPPAPPPPYPASTNLSSPALPAGVPASPMLFISSKYDPACPLDGAKRMVAGHPGSGLVVADGYGHGALTVGWSECMNAVIRDYLANGTVPEEFGIECETKCKPFREWECDAPQGY